MKKVAAVFVSIGVILVIIGLVIVGIFGGEALRDIMTYGFSHNLDSANTQKDYQADELADLEKIDIRVDSYSVYILPSSDGALSVKYVSPLQGDATLTVDDSQHTLCITEEDGHSGNRFFLFNLFNNNRFIALYVPQTKEFTDVELAVDSEVGNVSVNDVNLSAFNCKINTGSVAATNVCLSDALCAEVGTGSVRIEKLTCDLLQATTDTGSINISDSDAITVILETDTGSVNCNAKSQRLNITTDTGSIRFKSSASEIRLSADTGSVTGTVEADKNEYRINVKHGTGSSNIENEDNQSRPKLLTVNVGTGSINIGFGNE
ncbi:MAG: DUF4097 domain-containing protein [Corallococcus sp.]|nr:DUF4097 domain-containing protein [Corallococcus sp.]